VEVLAFAKQRKPFQVQFGLKNTLKIPVFTSILMAVYIGICDIDPLYERPAHRATSGTFGKDFINAQIITALIIRIFPQTVLFIILAGT
jgi:hypothetical protein